MIEFPKFSLSMLSVLTVAGVAVAGHPFEAGVSGKNEAAAIGQWNDIVLKYEKARGKIEAEYSGQVEELAGELIRDYSALMADLEMIGWDKERENIAKLQAGVGHGDMPSWAGDKIWMAEPLAKDPLEKFQRGEGKLAEARKNKLVQLGQATLRDMEELRGKARESAQAKVSSKDKSGDGDSVRDARKDLERLEQARNQVVNETVGQEYLLDNPGLGKREFPRKMRKRCTEEDRKEQLEKSGIDSAGDEVVSKGLAWLKSEQNKDGSWGDISGPYKVGVTGLAVLAYLGHSETPMDEAYGESCRAALLYLLDNARANGGKLATHLHNKHWVFEHAIATYALCEAYTYCSALDLEIAAALREQIIPAVRQILDNQCGTGAWDYGYDTQGQRGGDLSVSAWQVQALNAFRHTGLDAGDIGSVLSSAGKYARDCFFVVDSQFGSFAYQKGGNSAPGGDFALSGAGVLTLQMCGDEHGREISKTINSIVRHDVFEYQVNGNLYAEYYKSQALYNRFGPNPVWKRYSAGIVGEIVANQKEDGSWKAPSMQKQGIHIFTAENRTGQVLRNSLNCLILEVFYRYLPGTANLREK